MEPGRLKAVLRIPETQAKDLTMGQPAAIDTRNGIVKGAVARIDPAVQNGTVTVDVRWKARCRAAPGPTSRWTGRSRSSGSTTCSTSAGPPTARPTARSGLFKLAPDGREATRINVRLGRTSVNTVEVLGGLQPGEKVIISDMSRWDGVDRVRVE